MSILYFWGKSISANSFTTSKCESILKINSDEEITEISCGHDHAFFKSATGYLYAFGNNSYGQLGIINRQTNNVDICRVMISTKKLVVAISCGWNHTLVLDQAGDVFSCGKGADGALGYGVGENSYSFGFVLKGARKISAGLDHSLAICGSKVMGWGNCTYGQLGFPHKKIVFSPKELNVFPCKIALAGAKYSLFVTSKGVYGTGINSNCQLGLGHYKTIFVPKRINIDEPIVEIKGGNYCFAITSDKKCYLWGNGCFGVFKYPTKLQFLEDCEKIAVGLNFALMKKTDGSIHVWGSNRHGYLSVDSKEGVEYSRYVYHLSALDLDSFECGGNFVLGTTLRDLAKRQRMNNHYEVELDWPYSNEYNVLYPHSSAIKSMTMPRTITQPVRRSRFDSTHNNFIEDSSAVATLKNVEERIDIRNYYKGKLLYLIVKQNRYLEEQAQIIEKYQLKEIVHVNDGNHSEVIQGNEQIALYNVALRKKLYEKYRIIQDIREEYLHLSTIVENNEALSELLKLNGDHYESFKKKLKGEYVDYDENNITDVFGQGLTKLKGILEGIIDNKK